MYKLLFVLSILSFHAFGSGYYGRFWRGEERKSYPELRNYCDDRYSDCFLELVNRWLIPATPSYAAETILKVYAPVFLPRKYQKNYHDEVALILYTSEKEYKALRSDKNNLEGIEYGPIHGDIFDMGVKGTPPSSRSVVPQPFENVLKLEGKLKEVSYDLFSNQGDLVNSHSEFIWVSRAKKEVKTFLSDVQKYLRKLKSQGKAEGIYVLVTESYFMQYNFSKNKRDFEDLAKLLIDAGFEPEWKTQLKESRPVQTSPLFYERISYGEGANIWFEFGKKPGFADHFRLHLRDNT